jgi:signal peptidase I
LWWLWGRGGGPPIAAGEKKPFWVTWGAEMFGVLLLITAGRVALADWPTVPTGSMEPTVRVGDYLLVNKLAYGPRLPFTNTAIPMGRPERGDVVVFRFPLDVSTLYVKRAIGLPGDVVDYDHGIVRVNDEPFRAQLDHAYPDVRSEDGGQVFVAESLGRGAGSARHTIKLLESRPGGVVAPAAWAGPWAQACRVQSAQRWTCHVPAGMYLMMGDNRDNSLDSRVWGFLDERQIYGKAVRVLVNFRRLDRSLLPL